MAIPAPTTESAVSTSEMTQGVEPLTRRSRKGTYTEGKKTTEPIISASSK